MDFESAEESSCDGDKLNRQKYQAVETSLIENAAAVTSSSGALAVENWQFCRNLQPEPEVGMVFHAEEQAYAFYNTYAYVKGFSVRKGHSGRRKDNSIRHRVFVCSNEGMRQKHRTHVTRRPRETNRSNCMARIEFKVSRDGIWTVSKVICEHNHPLVRPQKSHLLRSHRKKKFVARQEKINGTQCVQSETPELPAEQLACVAESVAYMVQDQCVHLHSNRTRELNKGDAQVILEFFRTKQVEDPSFFYAVQLDDSERATNFFWTDARSMMDYNYFGDVVLYDTTYRTSKGEVPFAPFLGINHHKQIIVLGSSLLLDETTDSFVWLFKTFMAAMYGLQPKTIFTDICPALSRAVSAVLPESCHRFCLWHILHNCALHLPSFYFSVPNFQMDLKNCLHGRRSEEGFQVEWFDFIRKYNLADNLWLQDLFESRHKWALLNHGSPFCASMSSLCWNENMKTHFRKLFNRRLPLLKFLEQYQKILFQIRKRELYEDNKSRQTKPVVLVDMPMLKQAADSFTRIIYGEFEDEFKSQLSCRCEPIAFHDPIYTFKVSFAAKYTPELVEFEQSKILVSCSCRKFQTTGVLCTHALKVLNYNNVQHLPCQYILKRWTRYANAEVVPSKIQLTTSCRHRDTLTTQFNRVLHKAVSIAVKSAFSEDALKIFENEINKMASEVDTILHDAPLRKGNDDECNDIVDDAEHNTYEVTKKSKTKKDFYEKKKKGLLTPVVSLDVPTKHPPQHDAPSHIEISDCVIVDDSSQVTSYHQNGLPSYCNHIPLQRSGNTFPRETIITSADTFVPPSQGLFDAAITSQSSDDSNLAWINARVSVGTPLPAMQIQSHNFVNWAPQSRAIPEMFHSQLESNLHPCVQNHSQLISCSLNFDINKGL